MKDHDSQVNQSIEHQLRRDNVPTQVVWYALVGALSLSADLCVFVTLLWLGLPAMPTLVVGFVIGALVNYFLSRWFAFTHGRYRQSSEILRLFAVAIIGLGLTVSVFSLLMNVGFSPLVAKLIATAIAFFWNYFGRRAFVFHKEMPNNTWNISQRVTKWISSSDTKRSHDE